MIQLSGRFLKYNLIDKNGVQFPKSATIKIPSKVFVLFNFDKSHPIGIAKVIKDEEGLLAEIESEMDDILELLEYDKVGCGGYYRAVAIILIKMGYGGETWQYWVILVLMTVYGGAFACEKDKEELE